MLTAISDKGKEFSVEINKDGQSGQVNGSAFAWDVVDLGDRHYSIILNNKSYNLEVLSIDRDKKEVNVVLDNELHTFSIKDRFDALLAQLGMDIAAGAGDLDVRAPMPGMVLDVMVQAGDKVSEGQPLLILEAMKMENVLKAPSDAEIASIKIEKGKAVEKNEVLIEFAAE